MDYLWLCLSAVAAGAVNAVAGGGTLLTYPVLERVISANLANAASTANATSTVALFPGSLASAVGYRRQLASCKRWIVWLTVPSLLGGALGALLVREDSFKLAIPWLIFLAAVLFLLQPALARFFRREAGALREPSRATLACIIAMQFLVAIYGGYFGAGIGILMLSSLSFLGLKDIHEINALKSFLALCVNLVAAGVFIYEGLVQWPYALAMAGAAIVGGFLGARFALLLKPPLVRGIVILIGFGLAAYYFTR